MNANSDFFIIQIRFPGDPDTIIAGYSMCRLFPHCTRDIYFLSSVPKCAVIEVWSSVYARSAIKREKNSARRGCTRAIGDQSNYSATFAHRGSDDGTLNSEYDFCEFNTRAVQLSISLACIYRVCLLRSPGEA